MLINGTYAGAYRAVGNTTSIELPSSIKAGDPVVLSVVVHNLGQNLDWSDNGLSRQSRGHNPPACLQGAVTWRVRAPSTEQTGDTARTMYNNGDLYGERAGWYLPGMPDKTDSGHDDDRRPSGHPVVPLHLQPVGAHRSGHHLPGRRQAFWERQGPGGVGADHSQATIFVNGWNTGVYVGDVGPQTRFVIPAGFINFTVRTPSPSLWPPRKRVPVLRRSPSSRPIRSRPRRGPEQGPAYSPRTPGPATGTVPSLVPLPHLPQDRQRAPFTLKDSTVIVAKGQASESAKFLAAILRRSTGFPLPIVSSGSGPTRSSA